MSKFKLKTLAGVTKGTEEYNKILSERNKIKKEALLLVLSTIKENSDKFDQDVLDAAECLVPRSGKGRVTKGQVIADLFVEVGDELDEDDIFIKYKYGRAEMRGFCRDMIKKAATPETRKWVSFNPETGIYKLAAIGSFMPDYWNGYVPPTITDNDLDNVEGEDL
jgi:hypothetical protein